MFRVHVCARFFLFLLYWHHNRQFFFLRQIYRLYIHIHAQHFTLILNRQQHFWRFYMQWIWFYKWNAYTPSRSPVSLKVTMFRCFLFAICIVFFAHQIHRFHASYFDKCILFFPWLQQIGITYNSRFWNLIILQCY